jgi:hypothetical protein
MYTCNHLGRYTTIVSKTPCDWQEMRKCALPREQEQVASVQAFRKTDLYSILAEQD